MSVRMMAEVFASSQATGNDRLVLLAIADEANDDGTNAYPGLPLLAEKARIPRRTVQRCIERLVALGELHQDRPKHQGRGKLTHYTVLLGKVDTLTPFPEPADTEKGRQKGAERAQKGCQKGDTPPPVTSDDAQYAVPSTQYPGLGGETSSPSPPKRARQFPDFWRPNPTHRRLAEERTLDVHAEAEQFEDFHRSKGSKFVDWDRAFNTWLRNSDRFASPARTLRVVNGDEPSNPPRPRDVPADAVYFNGSWMY